MRVRRRWQQDALPTFRAALAPSIAGPFDRAHPLEEKEDGTPSARAFASVSPRDPSRSVVIECGGSRVPYSVASPLHACLCEYARSEAIAAVTERERATSVAVLTTCHAHLLSGGETSLRRGQKED